MPMTRTRTTPSPPAGLASSVSPSTTLTARAAKASDGCAGDSTAPGSTAAGGSGCPNSSRPARIAAAANPAAASVRRCMRRFCRWSATKRLTPDRPVDSPTSGEESMAAYPRSIAVHTPLPVGAASTRGTPRLTPRPPPPQAPGMPKVTPVSPALAALIHEQDGVVTAGQLATHGFSRDTLDRRVASGRWQRLVPGTVLTVSGEPTRRQRLVAAILWGGDGAAIDGPDACDWHGLRPDWLELRRVHIVVPRPSPARSQMFVTVRRAMADITLGGRTLVPYVDAATAVIVAARGARTKRQAIALLSRALQTGLVDLGDLATAREAIGHKWCASVDEALLAVGVGLRSASEYDCRQLILTSCVPEPLWNPWLDLGDGSSLVSPDALWVEAGLVHETNGRAYHAWGLAFDEMQARHDRLTAAGLIVLHNSPRRIKRDPAGVRAEIERAHARYAGRGLPAGVRLVPPPGNGG